VYEKQPYSIQADAYSVGVSLLELCSKKRITAEKVKQAQQQVAQLRNMLPDKPMANLLRSLLAASPDERLTCRDALDSNTLMQRKFGGAPLKRLIDFHVLHVSVASFRDQLCVCLLAGVFMCYKLLTNFVLCLFDKENHQPCNDYKTLLSPKQLQSVAALNLHNQKTMPAAAAYYVATKKVCLFASPTL
jgi:serine/threonine protein kinase